MKIVDRLILKELFGPFVNSVFMFLMLLFTSAYLSKLTDLIVRGASWQVVMQVAFYTVPLLLTQTLPMGMLMGTILAMGRLSGDMEHIAMHACGISFYRMAVPIAFAGLVVGMAAIAWNETIVPPATAKMYSLTNRVVEDVSAKRTPIRYDVKKPGTDIIEETVIIQGGYDSQTKSLLDVTILKMSEVHPGKPEVAVYAESAQAMSANPSDFNWIMHEVYVKYLKPVKSDTKQADTYFKNASPEILPRGVGLKRDFKGIVQAEVQDNRQMTFVQLRDKIRDKRAKNDNTYLADEFDLWSKISLPLASLIFGLVAAPLGLRPQRGSKTMGFGIAISIIFVYWVVHQWMYQVGKGGQLPPSFAAFTADFLGIIAAGILIARTRQ